MVNNNILDTYDSTYHVIDILNRNINNQILIDIIKVANSNLKMIIKYNIWKAGVKRCMLSLLLKTSNNLTISMTKQFFYIYYYGTDYWVIFKVLGLQWTTLRAIIHKYKKNMDSRKSFQKWQALQNYSRCAPITYSGIHKETQDNI